jgi:predicted component of type VI protein secretion system
MDKFRMFLVITNPGKLEKGSLPKSGFTKNGGMIGSASGSHWRLQNYQSSIAEEHTEIRLIMEQFCLIDRCGKTFVNGAHAPLGINQAIALNSGDYIQIGGYKIRVELLAEDSVVNNNESIDELMGVGVDSLLNEAEKIDLTLNENFKENILITDTEDKIKLDPLMMFEEIEKEPEFEVLVPFDNLAQSKEKTHSFDQANTNIESVSFESVDILKTEQDNHLK